MTVASSPRLSRTTPALAALGCLAVALVAVTVDLVLGPAEASVTREGGPVELCSAGFYVVALAVLVARWPLRRAWPEAVLLCAMFLRELDVDKLFTSEGILSTKILVRETPIWEKVLAVIVLAVVAAALVGVLRQGARRLARDAAGRRPWALYTLGAVALTTVSKSIDGLGRKLAPFGIEVSSQAGRWAGRIEEGLEIGIPVLLLMAILALPRAGGRERA